MPAIDPNTVHFTGENSFLRLKTEADGPETTVCAHWRTLISPAGPGTCLFMRSDATGGEVRLYADNVGMARWLQGELETILNPPFADTAMPIAEAGVLTRGRLPLHLSRDRGLGRRPHRAELVRHGRALHADAAAGQRRHRAVGGLQLPHAVPDRDAGSRGNAGAGRGLTRTSCSGARQAPPAWPGPRPWLRG